MMRLLDFGRRWLALFCRDLGIFLFVAFFAGWTP